MLKNRSLFTYLLISYIIFISNASGTESVLTQTYTAPTAQALEIIKFSGELTLTTTDEPGIRLTLTGSKRQLTGITVDANGDHFRISQHGGRIAINSTVISGVTVISNSGNAHVVINGNPISAQDLESPVHAELVVNAALALTLSRLHGNAHIGPRQGPVQLDLSAGKVIFDALDDADLCLSGSGNIQVGVARGHLQTRLSGSGTIRIENAQLSQLETELSGVGDILIKGEAEQAQLALAGVGSIYIDSVKQQPTVTVTGLGKLSVGNWSQ